MVKTRKELQVEMEAGHVVGEGLGLGLKIKLCGNSVGLRRKEIPVEISRSRQAMWMVRRKKFPRSSKGSFFGKKNHLSRWRQAMWSVRRKKFSRSCKSCDLYCSTSA
jgi:hypothetical protein